jgi:hypothetical protein
MERRNLHTTRSSSASVCNVAGAFVISGLLMVGLLSLPTAASARDSGQYSGVPTSGR